MKIKLDALKDKFVLSLTKRGLTPDEADIVANVFYEAELRGKKTHGIAKFLLINDAITAREGRPEIIKEKGNYAYINAHKELGYLSAQFAINILIEKTKQFDNAFVGVINSYYYSMAGIYAQKIAEAGFVGIILNNGGPMAVAPYGGVDPIFGTNPIAIGIPTREGSLVLDMATSEKTWGEINLAKVEKRQLQDKTFFDKEGNFTVDPYKAEAIVPFGGSKGGGLNFIFEILTGAFVGAKMGSSVRDGYDLGFLFFAISPDMFTNREQFLIDVENLKQEIKSSRKMSGVKEIYLPGEKSNAILKKNLDDGEIEIEEDTWNNLCSFANGEDVKDAIGLVE